MQKNYHMDTGFSCIEEVGKLHTVLALKTASQKYMTDSSANTKIYKIQCLINVKGLFGPGNLSHICHHLGENTTPLFWNINFHPWQDVTMETLTHILWNGILCGKSHLAIVNAVVTLSDKSCPYDHVLGLSHVFHLVLDRPRTHTNITFNWQRMGLYLSPKHMYQT
jgi:hypothetical protein